MSTPEFQAKPARGPRVQFTVLGPSSSLGRNLALWFVYSLVGSLLAAYVGARTLGADAPYMTVFRVTSTVAVIGYVLAIFTGGAFGRLWR